MESKNGPNRRRRVGKTTSGTNSTRPFLSAFQNRLLAYELGSMSKSKIEKEASKPVPQLHRLVGHAAVFDSTTRFIIDHIEDTSVDLDQFEQHTVEDVLDEKELGCVDIASLDRHGNSEAGGFEESFEVTHHASFNGYAQLKAKDDCAVVVTTTLADTEDNLGEYREDESTSESDDDDSLDQESWSSSCSTGDRCRIRSDWELLDAFSEQVGGPDPIISHHNDDHLLWSQQPRVLSAKQADNLIFEAFG